MKPTILVVEDDRQISSLYRTMLKMEGYQSIVATKGETALMELMSKSPDILLLDLGLPDMDGNALIQKVRSFSDIPILVVSARTEDADKVKALDLGADDYLSKPFSVDELLARLRVMERRLVGKEQKNQSATFINGGLMINYAEQTVTVDQTILRLTPMEYRLLVLFSQNVGKVLTHAYITTKIWGSGYEGENGSLRVYMTMLRKKLHHQYIETCFGVGYKMVRAEEQ